MIPSLRGEVLNPLPKSGYNVPSPRGKIATALDRPPGKRGQVSHNLMNMALAKVVKAQNPLDSRSRQLGRSLARSLEPQLLRKPRTYSFSRKGA